PGDTINIISDQLDKANSIIVLTLKDSRSFIIHHPDLMLTMTSIANAMPCPRRPILQSMVKPSGPSSKSMLYGTLLHTLLQRAMSEQDFSVEATRQRLNDELNKESTKLDIWGADLGWEDVRLEVGAKAGEEFSRFANRWIGPSPKIPLGQLHANPGDAPHTLAISGLHDVEEDIWSPKWGLKGKVDASVQCVIQQSDTKDDGQIHVAPLEIKTGRSVGVMAHRAQTMLYTLLMEDRYNVPVPAGLLYYSQLDSFLRVEAKANEITALIMTRNDLANYLAKQRTTEAELGTQYSYDTEIEDTAFLPPTIDHPKECRTCYAVDTCMLYRKTEPSAPSSADDPINELFEEKTGHLSEAHVQFFKKWETLLTIEEQDIGRFRSQLWTMTAKKREKTGRCFSRMVISAYSNDLGKSLAKIHRHTYKFVRATSNTQQGSLLSGHIARGDPVSLSIEPDLLCLSRGFVTDLTPESISIGVTYVIDTAALLARTRHKNHAQHGDQVEFRIDKDEMASGIMRMRANLVQLFFAGVAENLRRQVVDLAPPIFEPARVPQPHEIPASLNEDQARAMSQALSAKDYALILGMPGTGKTSTIAEIIKALVDRGKTVLLSSYTHSAVDTILMKLLNAEFDILRLGNIDKVHPDVQHLTLEAMESSTSMPQFEARLMGPPVVAATCLAVDQHRKLPFQLVKNAEARRGGLDTSLFKLLSEAHPSAVTDLSYQYRMSEDIMMLSNELIYEGRLKCGSEAVARQSLTLARELDCAAVFPKSHGPGSCWIRDLLDDQVKAVFVDTDNVPALDSKVGSLVQNEVEANLVCQLASALIGCGVKENDIAVITPYRQQIKLLTGLFSELPRVEIMTADKSQGRDKECILISLVRSNKDGNIGDLLKDWRRINVSFTRAKRKLVIFGSRSTLETNTLLKDFLKLMSRQGWIYELPSGALNLHALAEVKTEADESMSRGKAKIKESLLRGKGFISDILAVSCLNSTIADRVRRDFEIACGHRVDFCPPLPCLYSVVLS
ncbi:AAA domain-domain-containing protein, partial [Kockovaella imperatae]